MAFAVHEKDSPTQKGPLEIRELRPSLKGNGDFPWEAWGANERVERKDGGVMAEFLEGSLAVVCR